MEIRVHFPGGKKVQAEFQGHTVLTDQPVPAGGDGAAPSPYDLFLASLATCAGFFALNFCQSRGLPTEGLEVRQRDTWDAEQRRLAGVAIEVVAPHGFPEKYLEALRRAAEGCKVKRVVADPPEFEVVAKLR
jgi:putative redox protein